LKVETFTSFKASGLPQKEVGGILADYLALDRARMFRRLLVLRCGALAIAALIMGSVIDGLSAWARWVPVALFTGVPACVWIAEFVREFRFSKRLNRARLRKS
jgi:hypothetical protein